MNGIAHRLVAVMALAACLGGGCYRHRASVYHLSEQLPHATEERRAVAWTWLWGHKQGVVQPDNCRGNGASEVTVTTNFAFALLTVVSLGFVSPSVVAWRCAKDPPPARITAPPL